MSNGTNEQQRHKNKRFDVPGLFWAAAALAAVNIVLVVWFAVSPNLLAGSHANVIEKVRAASEAWKPSPFTPTVDDQPRPARTRVAKVRPMPVSTIDSIDGDGVSYEPPSAAKPPIGADVLHTVYEHAPADPADRPQRIADDDRGRVIRGAQMYDMLEKQTDMPRVTASNFNKAGHQAETAIPASGNSLAR